jgi:soluble lytic murein transglycosylase
VWLAVERMTTSTRKQATWQYWLGRSMAARGQRPAARRAYTRAARDNGFYGILAREALGDTRDPASSVPTAEEIAAASRDPSIRRTVALLRSDFRSDGLREWAWLVRHSDDRRLIAAAHYFEQAGLWDRVVDTAERTVGLFDLRTRYPLAHGHAVRTNAAKARVDPALVFSVARQESRFYPHARSLAGATGLIQVMPSTGAWMAKKLGLGGQIKQLAEIDFNLRIGSQYLRTLLDDLGHPMLAFAAYNAGPGRALNWLGNKRMDAAAYAESIPLDETREYTKHVAANAHYYKTRMAGRSVSLSRFLGSMPAANGATASARDAMPPDQIAAAESDRTIR